MNTPEQREVLISESNSSRSERLNNLAFFRIEILFAKQAVIDCILFPPGSWKKRCCTCCKRSFQHFTSTQTSAKVAANADMCNDGVPYSTLLCETLAASKYYIVLRSKNYHQDILPINFLLPWTHAVANLGVYT